METQFSEEKIKSLMLEVVAKENPENAQKLMQIMRNRHGIGSESITHFLIELENEGKLKFTFTNPKKLKQTSVRSYLFSQNIYWYWGIVAFSIATVVSVFAIPETVLPLAYIRNVLGLVFVFFLPGYAVIKAIFPTTVPIQTGSENFDNIIHVVLSIGMSLALVPLVSLILNSTPWGMSLAPMTLSLLALTVICSTGAVLRVYHTKLQKLIKNLINMGRN